MAEFEISNFNISRAQGVYARGLTVCPQLELWTSYVKFVYCTGTVDEFRKALMRAVDKLRWDPRAAPLWRELLLLDIRIYNSSLLSRGQVQGLLSDFTGRATGPLIPTDLEQKVFRTPLSPGGSSLVDQYGDVNVLRTNYQTVGFKQRFTYARKAHVELTRLTRDIDWSCVALPLSVPDKSRQVGFRV
ncbi:hypothetical protein, conserved [Eimeria necatrix]|uniref:Uncharacterized protein n=1 Tax=Eimeria necatrix TaxID=51315 RepID=U6MRX1_9EIME|nr:hypothetical protein, conserved [Eimeria necatrix]CDJ66962.1 hypothetical protein, conserved [Eimeria necatrix]